MFDPETDWKQRFPDFEDREEAARLVAALQAAKQALADHPVRAHVDGNEVLRCEKSGMVIVEGDETVEDLETGEVWLRAAIGLPPRAIVDDDEAEETVDESEFEDA